MSRINHDIKRFKEIGENHRMDLKEFIKKGYLQGDQIKIPIKRIELPEFKYAQKQKGGLGKGDAEEGDPVDAEEDDEDGDPGDETTEHEYYEMDPDEFAEKLDDELGLNFDAKGQKVVEKSEGDFNETARAGPNSTLDKDHLVKQAIKRHATTFVDEEYIKEVLKVRGMGVESTWLWTRENNLNISKSRIQRLYSNIPESDKTTYDDIDDITRTLQRHPPRSSYRNMEFRSDDERYRAPETVKEPQHNAVVINIRDVSGSMRKNKRELVERVFTPLDWYLQGKYENVEFEYIAHDSEAWRVTRNKFFGVKSGGGTKVSSAFELLREEVLQDYPKESWNRFIFAAGDGENSSNDTQENLIPLMEQISAKRQAYVETQPGSVYRRSGSVGNALSDHFEEDDDYRITFVESKNDVIDSIRTILDNVNGDD